MDKHLKQDAIIEDALQSEPLAPIPTQYYCGRDGTHPNEQACPPADLA